MATDLRMEHAELRQLHAAQALPGRRAAPGQQHPRTTPDPCPIGPPVPPKLKAPAIGGTDQQAGGGGDSFFQIWEAQALSITCGFVPLLPCTARFFQGDRRVRKFSTSTGWAISSTGWAISSTCLYSAARPVSFLSFLFSEERERERGQEGAQGPIHRFSSCLKKHPQVRDPIHGFSVDDFLSKSQCWRGFTSLRESIHASTQRNAPLPPFEACHAA